MSLTLYAYLDDVYQPFQPLDELDLANAEICEGDEILAAMLSSKRKRRSVQPRDEPSYKKRRLNAVPSGLFGWIKKLSGF